MEGAVILVTGATDGLGKRVARDLASQGATVLLHGRDRGRAEKTARDIEQGTGRAQPPYYLADLSSLDEVRRLADEVQAENDRLDVLVNNAGIGSGPSGDEQRSESADGHELRFAVNYLSQFLLTNLLLPLLRDAAPSRIVNVASAGQTPIDFDDVMLEHGYSGWRAYAQSKLAQIMFTFSLAERLRGSGVAVNALHPASLMDTKMVFESFGSNMTTVAQGAAATVNLAVSPELEGVSGRYFDGLQEARANDQAYDEAARRRLWDLSESLTNSQ